MAGVRASGRNHQGSKKVVLIIKVKGAGRFWLDDLVAEENTPAVQQPVSEKVGNAAANGTVQIAVPDVIAPKSSVALSNAALETNPAVILTPTLT